MRPKLQQTYASMALYHRVRVPFWKCTRFSCTVLVWGTQPETRTTAVAWSTRLATRQSPLLQAEILPQKLSSMISAASRNPLERLRVQFELTDEQLAALPELSEISLLEQNDSHRIRSHEGVRFAHPFKLYVGEMKWKMDGEKGHDPAYVYLFEGQRKHMKMMIGSGEAACHWQSMDIMYYANLTKLAYLWNEWEGVARFVTVVKFYFTLGRIAGLYTTDQVMSSAKRGPGTYKPRAMNSKKQTDELKSQGKLEESVPTIELLYLSPQMKLRGNGAPKAQGSDTSSLIRSLGIAQSCLCTSARRRSTAMGVSGRCRRRRMPIGHQRSLEHPFHHQIPSRIRETITLPTDLNLVVGNH